MALEQDRLLVTTDKGSLPRRGDSHFGLLVVRPKQPNREPIHRRVMSAVAQFPPHTWPGLAVVMRDAVQSRWRAAENGSPHPGRKRLT